jgi:hypothetical protein
MRTVSRPANRNANKALVTLAACSAIFAVAITVGAGAKSPSDRPDHAGPATVVRPPRVDVLTHRGRMGRGLVFMGAKPTRDAKPGQIGQQGPLVVDDRGRPVWFKPLPKGITATDVRVQRYRGRPVITWAQGKSAGGSRHSSGVDVIANSHYKVIARIHAGDGMDADQHEFLLTRRGTALITSYHRVPADLSVVGGPVDGSVYEGVVQEIDLATHRVVFEWHSLDHVALDESFHALPERPDATWDYFHINSIGVARDGNLLVSARQTSTVYKVDRRTGRVIWRLGGKRSNFILGPNVYFAYQHNAEPVGAHTVRIFDNHSHGQPGQPDSRVIWVRLDPRTRRATLERAIAHPSPMTAGSQGNAQVLRDGHVFVGWGSLGRVSEFNRAGRLLFDATLPSGYETYRAYRAHWTGLPDSKPRVVASADDGGTEVDAIWNGATEVTSWRILGGDDPHELRGIGSYRWNGLDTAVHSGDQVDWVKAVALDRAGRPIASSRPVRAH